MRYCTLILLLTGSLWQRLGAQTVYPPIQTQNVTIVRDAWGVPHIYGKTDEETAYGLAWAHAEDDFHTIQEHILTANCQLASVKGKEGAVLDFIGQLIFAKETVDSLYERELSEDFRRVLNGYVQGLNAYAAAHPEEVLGKGTFPITEKTLLTGNMTAMTIVSTVGYDLRRIFEGTITNQEASDPGPLGTGSNSFAFHSSRTDNGKTFLSVNSHQPLEGAFAWYECHVNSEEGWNMLGGTFPGGLCPFVGTNPNLGWAHTVNYPDLCDVYKLTMHPTKKNYYKYDGQWLKLETRKAKLKVKLGGIRLPVTKKYYRSVYGPTLKNKHGFYAMRFPANHTVKYVEQWYHMNKATNFHEFMQAMKIQGHVVMNTIYADRSDTIFMICNGHLPYRNPNYNWRQVLPGDTSATLWPIAYYPLDSLPQYLNPPSGYLFNTNNTPFNATGPADNLRPSMFNPTMGMLEKDVNRSIRFQKLMAQENRLSYADFKRIKSDMAYQQPLYTRTLENLALVQQLDPAKYPDIADAIDVLKRWNGDAHAENQQAPLFSMMIQFLIKHLNKEGIIDYNNMLPEEDYVDAIRKAKKHLLKHFGKLEFPLGELQKHVRGDVELPMWGLPETICQMYTKPYKDGKLRSYLGDSYIMLLQFSANGVEIETVNAYGASNKPGSKHYTDQMQMFVNQQYKKMTLDKEEIFRNAERIYHPGE